MPRDLFSGQTEEGKGNQHSLVRALLSFPLSIKITLKIYIIVCLLQMEERRLRETYRLAQVQSVSKNQNWPELKVVWSTVPCLLDTMPSNQRTCRVDSGMSPPCALTPYHPSSCVLSSSTFLCVLLESFPHPSQSVGPLEVLIPYSSYLYCDFQNLFVCFHSGPVVCPFVFLFSAKAAEEHSTVPCM